MNSARTNYRWVRRYSGSDGMGREKWCLEKYMGERTGGSLYGGSLPEWETVYAIPVADFPEFVNVTMSDAVNFHKKG